MFAGGRARKETIKKPSNSFCHIRKHYFWWGNKGWGMIILYTKLVTITTQAKKKKKSLQNRLQHKSRLGECREREKGEGGVRQQRVGEALGASPRGLLRGVS